MSLGQTIAVIGIGLNVLSLGLNLNSAGRAYGRGDTAAGNESMAWAMVDALLLMLPFAGPGSSAGRAAVTNTGRIITITTYQLSRLGVQASALWGYLATLSHAIRGLDISYASSGGGSGSGSSSDSGGYQHQSSEGPGDWYSGEYFKPGGAANYQAARTGKPAGWFYRLKNYLVNFDGFRGSAGEVVEVKHSGYDFLLGKSFFYKPAAGKQISGAQALVNQARNQVRAAKAHGLQVVWEVKDQASRAAIEAHLVANRIAIGPGELVLRTIP